ncbi:MAG: mandelate racemase/muconate lactonizing enzyme family protein, partial [Planctomycetes bacterium]|nr:mandelate racemase/muconate lactonizing enzyme family protein [Planctomycetota bacterium]
ETPLNVQWAWPSSIEYHKRFDAMTQFSRTLAKSWCELDQFGHPIELGTKFTDTRLTDLLNQHNQSHPDQEPMPHLAALICSSAFDIALHDAYGNLLQTDIYKTYNSQYMNHDLSHYLTSADGHDDDFTGKYPADFLIDPPPQSLPAWHLVGGMDCLDDSERSAADPDDGYPVLLPEWIKRDGLTCLKIKLRGNDWNWDYQRLEKVGQIAIDHNVLWLTTDFNCTVSDPHYVNEILDRLMIEHPRIFQMILYVEQPFPYDLEQNQIDVHSLSARKPLFMDESAHDWKLIRLGRKLGWTGVALKTCKTQTGALLSLAWAKSHGLTLMVQDLTNPMLAQIPHLRLAAHAGTIMGVETNAMQFYPNASEPEAKVHPNLYQRKNGQVNLKTLKGPGFGYQLNKIKRTLPTPAESFKK